MNALHRLLSSPLRARRVLLVYWLAMAIGTHWPRLDLFHQEPGITLFQGDKLLHVLGFGGLMGLLFFARLAGRRASDLRHALTALLIAGIYAGVDEYTQQWFERQVSLSDVLAGLVGLVGVYLIILAPARRMRVAGGVRVFRVVTFLSFTFILILELAPQGNRWIQQMAGLVFQPWAGIDKAGHFYVSAVLTLLLAWSSPAGVHRPRQSQALSIVVMGLAGPIIETAQSYTGRSVELADLYAHEVGMFAAMIALAALATRHAAIARS